MEKNVTDKLKDILAVSGWSQERLAHELGVSFATLNAWISGKSKPRAKALEAIEDAYLNILGRVDIDRKFLEETKKIALTKKIEAKELIKKSYLLDKLTLFLTYHTNTIEGSTLTLSEVKEILDDDDKILANKTAREQIEARNHRAAMFYLLDELASKGKRFVWTEEVVLGIHLRLMNSLISNAGFYRNHGVRIMGSSVVLANHLSVHRFMRDFIEDLNKPARDVIENIARMHFRFERIHPFSDGNGRTGRLIMFAQALQRGIMPPLVLKERKRAYYKYLDASAEDENCELLSLFIAESILATSKVLSEV